MTEKLNISDTAAQALIAAKGRFSSTLEMFRPTEKQEPFFLAMELDYIIEMLLGGGNRAGKSICATICMASFILNRPVTFNDGSKHHMRPERWRNEALKIWIVGYDWKHIGKTMHRLLFESGLYRIIRDQKTGKWRAWNPEDPAEASLKYITTKSPPIIRMTEVVGGHDGMSWENKKEKQISRFEVNHDGTSIQFFPSTGARPQGDPANVIWIDEAIEDDSWYTELQVRLMDDDGRLMWTAWPDVAPTEAMSKLEERAAKQAGKPRQRAFHIVLKGSDNPFTQGEHRDYLISTMSEDEASARDGGAMNKGRWRIYPNFDEYVHRLMTKDPGKDDVLAKAVREAGGIPPEWTRYLILDPGTINPGVLMVAFPPPSLGDFIVPFDELNLHNVDADRLAQAVAAKTKGTYFEDFIIDSHAARQTPMGVDFTIGENYEKAFAKYGLRSRRRGARFSFGSDNVLTRIFGLRGRFNIRTDGTSQIRIDTDACPTLVSQLKSYRRKSTPDRKPMEEPASGQKNDIAVCLEYLISRDDCGYVNVPTPGKPVKDHKAEVMKSLNVLLGRTDDKKPASRTVFCGAGTIGDNPFS